jgi:hypothetical protein
MFEPFFDQYLPSVIFNGGKPVYVPLHPPTVSQSKPTSNDWTIDFEELRHAASYLIVHFPHSHQAGHHPAHKDDYRQYSAQSCRKSIHQT